jgi:hypothetical protein
MEGGCLCLGEDGCQAAASTSVHYKMGRRQNEPHISNGALNVTGPQRALTAGVCVDTCSVHVTLSLHTFHSSASRSCPACFVAASTSTMSAVSPEGEIRGGAFVKEEVVGGGLFC